MKPYTDILKIFENSSLDFKLRQNNIDEWDENFSALEYKPVDYLAANIDYQTEYQKQNFDEFIDISSIIFSNGNPIAIWPISIGIKDGKKFFSSQGENILPPIFLKNTSSKQIKKCISEIHKICIKVNLDHSKKYWMTSCAYVNKNYLSAWHLLCMTKKAECSLIHNLYVDLDRDIDEIWSNFRKSYKPLINKGEKLWNIEVHKSSIEKDIWSDFKNLHLNVSGRKTRSDKSWEIQFNNIKANNAFLITLKNDKNLVGGALFSYTLDEGRYDVGAYDRSLFDKPIGHAAQFTAIKEFKKMNLSLYKIGRRFYASDIPAPTEKELSIADFKEGFASFTQPEFILKNFI